MLVLVTGATGTIGSAVVRALRRRGHDVIGVVRAGTGLPDGVASITADLFEPEALADVLPRADAFVHAASSNDERAGGLDHGVIETTLRAFAGTDKPLLYTSGLWLHGNTGAEPATEDSPFDPPMVVSWRPDVERVLAEAAPQVRTVRIRRLWSTATRAAMSRSCSPRSSRTAPASFAISVTAVTDGPPCTPTISATCTRWRSSPRHLGPSTLAPLGIPSLSPMLPGSSPSASAPRSPRGTRTTPGGIGASWSTPSCSTRSPATPKPAASSAGNRTGRPHRRTRLLMPTPKIWFLTGASRGLGRAFAETALSRGDRVARPHAEPTACPTWRRGSAMRFCRFGWT